MVIIRFRLWRETNRRQRWWHDMEVMCTWWHPPFYEMLQPPSARSWMTFSNHSWKCCGGVLRQYRIVQNDYGGAWKTFGGILWGIMKASFFLEEVWFHFREDQNTLPGPLALTRKHFHGNWEDHYDRRLGGATHCAWCEGLPRISQILPNIRRRLLQDRCTTDKFVEEGHILELDGKAQDCIQRAETHNHLCTGVVATQLWAIVWSADGCLIIFHRRSFDVGGAPHVFREKEATRLWTKVSGPWEGNDHCRALSTSMEELLVRQGLRVQDQ